MSSVRPSSSASPRRYSMSAPPRSPALQRRAPIFRRSRASDGSSASSPYPCTTPADELRINLSTPPKPAGTENRLGVLGGDVAGFPNGRRLTDDVVDIAERAVAGALKGNNVPLGDGVDQDDRALLPVFPYAPDPQSGADNTKGKS